MSFFALLLMLSAVHLLLVLCLARALGALTRALQVMQGLVDSVGSLIAARRKEGGDR